MQTSQCKHSNSNSANSLLRETLKTNLSSREGMKSYSFASGSLEKKKKKKESFTVQQNCHRSHLKTSAGMKSARNLFKCSRSDRYVFVLLGSVWCRKCPRRALKSTIQDPECQSTLPQPFRATNPSDSAKMASLAFFCAPFQRLINDHIQPLYGTWQAYEFFFLKGPWQKKKKKKKSTHCAVVQWEGIALRLCMNN